jgi:hypothetical protein
MKSKGNIHKYQAVDNFLVHYSAQKYIINKRCMILKFISAYRWVDNIKIDLREIGWDGRDWIDLTQDRDQWRALVRAVMNLRVP